MASLARTSLMRQTTSSIRRPHGIYQTSGLPARTLGVALLARTQRLGFQTTSRRQLLPQGPEVIQGTVNDPAPVPPPSPTHGHYEWTFYRVLSAGLIPLTVAPFASSTALNPTLDALFGAGLLVHAHLSMQTIIVDYVPKKTYPILRKICWYGLNAATVLAGIGLYEFETTDVGIVEAVKRIWVA